MENKYYVPSIEEFHVGFECEHKLCDTWRELTCYHIPHGHRTLEDLYRVKYLDKQDVEELGWKENLRETYFELEEYQLNLWYFENIPYVSIYNTTSISIFMGKIMNKSELKKLMEQLIIE